MSDNIKRLMRLIVDTDIKRSFPWIWLQHVVQRTGNEYHILWRQGGKRPFDALIIVILVLTVAFACCAVAEDDHCLVGSDGCRVRIDLTVDGEHVSTDKPIHVHGGEPITAYAVTVHDESIALFGYFFDIADKRTETVSHDGEAYFEFTVPERPDTGDTTATLWIEAVSDADDGSQNTITKTGWLGFDLVYD